MKNTKPTQSDISHNEYLITQPILEKPSYLNY